MTTLNRLHATVEAVAPIHGVGPVTSGTAVGPGNVRVDFHPEATAQQQTDAAAAVAAFDWTQPAHDAWLNLKARADAAATLDLTTADAKVLRGVALVLIDEVNALRQWLAAFKAETAAATNLANFQTRVAGLPATPDRTLAQAKTAIQNAISAGSVD